MQVIIDGIEYIPKQREYNIGDKIKIKGLDFICIGNKEEYKFILKNILDEEHIKKYVDDDFMRQKEEVRHKDTIRPIKWEDSYIKKVVLPKFKEDLDIECEVDLLSRSEVLELPEDIRSCGKWYWTKTPYDFEKEEYDDSSSSAYFARVWNGGYSSHDGASNASGVRPLLKIKKEEIRNINEK